MHTIVSCVFSSPLHSWKNGKSYPWILYTKLSYETVGGQRYRKPCSMAFLLQLRRRLLGFGRPPYSLEWQYKILGLEQRHLIAYMIGLSVGEKCIGKDERLLQTDVMHPFSIGSRRWSAVSRPVPYRPPIDFSNWSIYTSLGVSALYRPSASASFIC